VKDIYDIVAEAQERSGESFALATLVHAKGSSYRRPGARLLICGNGRTVGSLSGGCIEDEIATHSRLVLETGEPRTIDFDTRRRFGCHGHIDIFIEKISPRFFADLAKEMDARRSCLIITTANGSQIRSCAAGEPVSFSKTCAVGEAVSFPKTSDWEASSFPYSPFVQVVHPPLRLLICGEGPDSLPLKQLCNVLGWEAVAVEDVQTMGVQADSWTAAIVKSHNFGRDFAILSKLLPLDLRYVGLIGPKKRRDELLNHLLEIDVPMNAGFFAPAGLDLNAETPEEIALSIVAEIQRVFADGSAQSLRDRKSPIHRIIDEQQSTAKAVCQKSAR
jgi:xanthine/CO dehydrogenase XdhC/CoxF family maturation factor